MKFLYWLESIRNPFFDWFFSTVTHLGDETAFLLIAIFIFWCVNKRSGYYLMISGFFGTIINQVMKLVCKVPRPWVNDPKFTTVGGAKETAPGYSFPSGHSQNSVNTFGAIFLTTGRRWLRIVCIVIAILVPFSRMYLGVHTPWDVVAGAACALVILISLEPLFKNDKLFPKAMPILIGVLTAGSIAFFIYSCIAIKATPADVNVQSAFKNAGTMLGCSAGIILVYTMDALVVKFETNAAWYSQIIKFAVGGGIVFLIKSLLKTPLAALMGDYERIVRYFLIVAFAGVVWPLTFGFFANLRFAALDRFGLKVVGFVTRTPVTEEQLAAVSTAKTKKTRTVGFTTVTEEEETPVKTVAEYTLNTTKDYRKISARANAARKRAAKPASVTEAPIMEAPEAQDVKSDTDTTEA